MTPPPAPIALRHLETTLAVCRLPASTAPAPWMQQGAVWSVTRTPDELSVVCDIQAVPDGVRHEGPFTAFMVEGPLDFALTGIVARLSSVLAEAEVPLFVISTFDTDYVLVREGHARLACGAWERAGLIVR